MPKVSVTGTALRCHFDEFSFSIVCTSFLPSNRRAKPFSPVQLLWGHQGNGHTIPYIGWCYHFSLGNAPICSVPAHHFYHFSVLRPRGLLLLLLQRAGLHSPSGSAKRRGALRRPAL